MNNNNERNKGQKQQEEDELRIEGPGGSTLQTPEEHQHDQSVDPRKDSTMAPSNDDLRKTDIDKFHEVIDGKRGDIPEIDDTLSNQK